MDMDVDELTKGTPFLNTNPINSSNHPHLLFDHTNPNSLSTFPPNLQAKRKSKQSP